MTSPISARDSLAPYLLIALASLAMVACGGSDDSTTVAGAPSIGAITAGDATVRVAVIYGHDKLAAEAGFINGITLSINGSEYLS